jgi:hypothetical protein
MALVSVISNGHHGKDIENVISKRLREIEHLSS